MTTHIPSMKSERCFTFCFTTITWKIATIVIRVEREEKLMGEVQVISQEQGLENTKHVHTATSSRIFTDQSLFHKVVKHNVYGWIGNLANLEHINMNYNITNFSIPSVTDGACSFFNRNVAKKKICQLYHESPKSIIASKPRSNLICSHCIIAQSGYVQA